MESLHSSSVEAPEADRLEDAQEEARHTDARSVTLTSSDGVLQHYHACTSRSASHDAESRVVMRLTLLR
jgi:hypothetical protein